MGLIVGLDIGGTFTDLIVFDEESGEVKHAKSSTTPADLVVGIVNCLKKSRMDMQACNNFVHGTTVAINTVIEEKGAKTALVTTEGARDVYRVGRGNRPESYNIFFKRPVPLVARHMTFEARERVRATGEALIPLQEEEAESVAKKVAAMEPAAVAVCFLHSFIHPSHEARMGTALRRF
jgi:N-methylhydantoinase A